MGPRRRFKSYFNLKTVRPKLERILGEFDLTTFEGFLETNPDLRLDK
jgi:hypothetical protein